MKRKIYLMAVWFMVIVLLPLSSWANVHTEKRNLFIGGYFEYLNTPLNLVDETYENKARSYRFNMNFGLFLQDNFAVGLKVGYGYSRDMETDTSLDYDFTFNTDVFRVGLFMRNYFELTRSISFFVESSVVSVLVGLTPAAFLRIPLYRIRHPVRALNWRPVSGRV